MRLLGVDFGFKRIGLAVAETDPLVISPRPVVLASGTLLVDAGRLIAVAKREEIDEIVVGLPLEDGGEGRMARICRTLADHLEPSGCPVRLVDETLTSVEAEENLKDIGVATAARRRKMRDAESARLILERYLNERKET